jgi:hypothetical protein
MANSSFWVATADTGGTIIEASKMLLSPGPSLVEYPTEPTGSRIETADGIVVVQQPTGDSRIRTWNWKGYRRWMTSYQNVYALLYSLRSRRRVEYGASPYVYVKDNTTQLLYKETVVTGTATTGGSTVTLVGNGVAWTDDYIGYQVEITGGTGAGQLRAVTDNTTNTLTVATAWTAGTPTTGSTFALRGRTNDWFKVRVVEVSETMREGGDTTVENLRFAFVIEDTGHNAIG